MAPPFRDAVRPEPGAVGKKPRINGFCPVSARLPEMRPVPLTLAVDVTTRNAPFSFTSRLYASGTYPPSVETLAATPPDRMLEPARQLREWFCVRTDLSAKAVCE